jgi:teichuronic acid biosynthesis glycosyltransferase TuaH
VRNNFDLVWLSIFRVKDQYSSTSLALAKEISKTNRLFFIDNPITIGEYLRGLIQQLLRKKVPVHNQKGEQTRNFIHIIPFVALSINWLPKGFIYNSFSFVNNVFFDISVSIILKKYAVKDYYFVNVFNPFYGRILSVKPKPRLKIYYSVDNMEFSPFIKKHGPYLEIKMVQSYDLVLATSQQLKAKLSSYISEVGYLPNAADTEIFKHASFGDLPKPKDIELISKPIIIYTGHIDWRVDKNLLQIIARHHPDKVLLLLGPVSLDKEVMTTLKSVANIIFLGSRPLHQLPYYLAHAQCAIIPFKLDEVTKSIYPLKINEYLSAGLPIVSTRFSPDIETFKGVISLENDHQLFAQKISYEIDSNNENLKLNRIKVAERNSWSARAEEFWRIVSTQITRRN